MFPERDKLSDRSLRDSQDIIPWAPFLSLFHACLLPNLLTALLHLLVLANLAAVPRELVVVELFTSTTCNGCPGAAMGVHDLLTNGHPVAVIANHPNDPYTSPAAVGRYLYYGPLGTPTAFFDGLDPANNSSSGTSLYPIYLPRVNARLAVPSSYTISATGQADSLNYTATVSIVKAEADTNSTVVLHAAVTESALPYVWFNQTTLENVNRRMVPDYNGTSLALNTLAPGEQLSLNLDFAVKHDWILDNCDIVFWLQNEQTREILQARKYTLAELVATGNQPPQITLPAALDFEVNSSLRLDFSAFVADPDQDELTLSCSANSHVLAAIEGLDVTLSAAQDWYGSEALVFSVSDGLTSVADTVLINVFNISAPNVFITRTGNYIQLTWDEIHGASSYAIWAADSADGIYTYLDSVEALSWSEAIPPEIRSRFYKVSALSR